jgi:hypothetical protein
MESSPWKLIDRKFQAAKFVGADISFSIEKCGTSLPEEPFDKEIFTLVDSLTVPTYMWTFRFNKASITYRWEFVGGWGSTIFAVDRNVPLNELTSTDFRNAKNHVVYYSSGSTFPLPYSGEYEFTGGVILNVDKANVQVSMQMVHIYRNSIKLGVTWPLQLEPGFNHVPLPIKRISGLQPGKVSLGIGSSNPSETIVRRSTCVIRPIKIQR